MLLFSGHNTDGKYFVTSNKMEYKCEMIPRKVNVFIEKTRDGHVIPVTDVDVREVACGLNHTVSGSFVDEDGENDAGLQHFRMEATAAMATCALRALTMKGCYSASWAAPKVQKQHSASLGGVFNWLLS